MSNPVNNPPTNQTEHIPQQTRKQNAVLSQSSDQWWQYFKKSKIDLEQINQAWWNNVETVDAENCKLKEAIREWILDLKEKEVSLDESQKIISKLKDEYTKLIQAYQNVEKTNLNWDEQLLKNKQIQDNYIKAYCNNDKLNKQNDQLKADFEKVKAEYSNLKTVYAQKTNEYNKKEKEFSDKDLLIADWKSKGETWVAMIKEREKIISDYNKTISQLNENIMEKEDQLKVMVNFSKNWNNENKSNVKELTKQAVQTIKLFYNALNGGNSAHINDKENINTDLNCDEHRIRIGDDTFDAGNVQGMINKNKNYFTLNLQESWGSVLFIPKTRTSISKEFLVDMNIKTELIKYELFACYIREFTIVEFWGGLFDKIDVKLSRSSSGVVGERAGMKDILDKVILIKERYEDCIKENEGLREWNTKICAWLKEQELYSDKWRRDMNWVNKKIKQKIEEIETWYLQKLRAVKEGGEKMKAKYTKDIAVLKNEITLMRDKMNKRRDDPETQGEHCVMCEGKTPIKYAKQRPFTSNTKDYCINSNGFTLVDSIKQSNSVKRKLPFTIDSNNIEYINDRSQGSNTRVPTVQTFKPQSNIKEQRVNINANTANNLSFQLNDSFNEKNYRQKKIENDHWKDEISRLKSEISSWLLEMNNQRNTIASNRGETAVNPFSELLQNVQYNQYKSTSKFYANFLGELNKLTSNTKEIFDKISDTSKYFNKGDESKVKVSHMKSFLKEVQKWLQLFLTFLNSHIKDNDRYHKTLINIFDFLGKYVYSAVNDVYSYTSSSNNNRNNNNNRNDNDINLIDNTQSSSLFTLINNNLPNIQMNIFSDITIKVFSSSELKKYHCIYNNKTTNEILSIFLTQCNIMKKRWDTIKWEYDTDLTERDDAIINKAKGEFLSSSSSYHVVNEEILKWKRKDTEVFNWIEITKNYLIAQEMNRKILLNCIESEGRSKDWGNLIAETCEKLYVNYEEVIHYRIDEIEDNQIFLRKLIVKLFMNQRSQTGMSNEFMQ